MREKNKVFFDYLETLKTEKSTAQITIRIRPTEKRKLKEKAKKENKSITRLIQDYIENNCVEW